MKYYIGIDPGKSGGVAILKDGVSIYDIFPIPIAGDEIDISSLHAKLEIESMDAEVVVYIEKVGAMPKQGVTSMFSFGFTTGAIHAVAACLGYPRYLVTPQAWKKKVLVGTAKDKNAAIEWCRRAFPEESLLATERSRKCHDGMADALCIATYAYIMDPLGPRPS
jgi:hypothetical protein